MLRSVNVIGYNSCYQRDLQKGSSQDFCFFFPRFLLQHLQICQKINPTNRVSPKTLCIQPFVWHHMGVHSERLLYTGRSSTCRKMLGQVAVEDGACRARTAHVLSSRKYRFVGVNRVSRFWSVVPLHSILMLVGIVVVLVHTYRNASGCANNQQLQVQRVLAGYQHLWMTFGSFWLLAP